MRCAADRRIRRARGSLRSACDQPTLCTSWAESLLHQLAIEAAAVADDGVTSQQADRFVVLWQREIERDASGVAHRFDDLESGLGREDDHQSSIGFELRGKATAQRRPAVFRA